MPKRPTSKSANSSPLAKKLASGMGPAEVQALNLKLASMEDLLVALTAKVTALEARDKETKCSCSCSERSASATGLNDPSYPPIKSPEMTLRDNITKMSEAAKFLDKSVSAVIERVPDDHSPAQVSLDEAFVARICAAGGLPTPARIHRHECQAKTRPLKVRFKTKPQRDSVLFGFGNAMRALSVHKESPSSNGGDVLMSDATTSSAIDRRNPLPRARRDLTRDELQLLSIIRKEAFDRNKAANQFLWYGVVQCPSKMGGRKTGETADFCRQPKLTALASADDVTQPMSSNLNDEGQVLEDNSILSASNPVPSTSTVQGGTIAQNLLSLLTNATPDGGVGRAEVIDDVEQKQTSLGSDTHPQSLEDNSIPSTSTPFYSSATVSDPMSQNLLALLRFCSGNAMPDGAELAEAIDVEQASNMGGVDFASQPISEWFFYSDVRKLPKGIVCGIAKPPGTIYPLPPRINVENLKPSLDFSFYVEHTTANTRDLTVDDCGRWNTAAVSSSIKADYYNERFAKTPKAGHTYAITKYSSINQDTSPLGSFTRRVWRGFAADGSPIGCAIISYRTSADFIEVVGAAHGNSKTSSARYQRSFPSTLAQLKKTREQKPPRAIMHDAFKATVFGEDARAIPRLKQAYNCARTSETKYTGGHNAMNDTPPVENLAQELLTWITGE